VNVLKKNNELFAFSIVTNW